MCARSAFEIIQNLTGRQTEAAARQKYTSASSRRVCLMELQLASPDRGEASPGNPAGRHPLRSAWHEKNSNRKLDAVRKREPHVRHVGFIYDGGLTELAHAARLLGAQQVAHAGMPADKFPRRGFLEALGSAAVRLQFHFLVLLHNFLVLSKFLRLKWRMHFCLP